MPPLKLEIFSEDSADNAPALVQPEEGDHEQRLATFEQGYAAGWDDAVAARTDEASRTREEVARHLQELSFTYYEARAHVLRGMAPFLGSVIGRFLPDLAQHALPDLIAEALRPHIELASESPVVIEVHPDARPGVEALLEAAHSQPYQIRTDPALSAGQARLRLGESETGIDTDAAIAVIRGLIEDFFTPQPQEEGHG